MSKEIEDVVSVMRKAKEEIESLRQQLAGRDVEVKHVLGKVILVEQQLADHIKREVMLRDVMQEVLDAVWLKTSHELARKFSEALAATADLGGLRVCHAEPVGFEYRCVKLPAVYFLEKTGSAFGYKGEWTKTKLYRAWEPK